MYPTTSAYKRAIRDYNRTMKIEGTITLNTGEVVSISDKHIVQGSLYVTNQCVSGEGLDPGSVYVGELGLSLISDSSRKPKPKENVTWAGATFSWHDAYLQWAGNADGVRWREANMSWDDADFMWSSNRADPWENYYELDGAMIHLNFGLLINGEYEYIPLGIFKVVEVKRKIGSIQLTAYDSMIAFDKDIASPPATGKPYAYLQAACSAAGIMLANTSAQINAFPNGNETLLFDTEDEIQTWRDLISWIAQILGCYAAITRDNKLILKTYLGEVVRVINSNERQSTAIEDFELRITAVSTSVSGTEYAVAAASNDGIAVVLDDNPMIRTLSGTKITQMLTRLLHHWSSLVYIPFTCDFMGDPALDAGDYVTVIGGSAGYAPGKTTLITHTTWRYRTGHTLKSVGKTGTISVAKTQTQKKVDKSIGSVKEGKNYYGTTITRDSGLVVEGIDSNENVISKAIFNSDEFTMQARNDDGDLEDRIYFNPSKKTYVFNGTLSAADGTFTGTVSAGKIISSTITGSTLTVTNAGVTNDGTASTSVRFWAGSTYDNRVAAPFRVTQAGAVSASNITITGGTISVDTDMTIGDNLYIKSNNVEQGIHFSTLSGNTKITVLNDAASINITPYLYESGKRVATREWVNSQLSNYATEDWVDDALGGLKAEIQSWVANNFQPRE